MTNPLPRAYAESCGRFIITVNWDYLCAPKQGKLASVSLHRLPSIFETSVIGSDFVSFLETVIDCIANTYFFAHSCLKLLSNKRKAMFKIIRSTCCLTVIFNLTIHKISHELLA